MSRAAKPNPKFDFIRLSTPAIHAISFPFNTVCMLTHVDMSASLANTVNIVS